MMKKGLFALLALSLLACSPKAKNEKAAEPAKTQKETAQQAPATPDDRGYLVSVGEMAPDFTMQLTDGSTVKLSELRGKLVMLQFTASWCGVCRKEMPHIEKQIWDKHKDNPNFALFGIDREEPLATVEKFVKQTGVTYPIGLDPKGDIFGAFADRRAGITRNVIIDPTGKIIMLTRLFEEKEFNDMVNLIDQQLASQK